MRRWLVSKVMLRKQKPNIFESRTQVWREVGLGGEVDRSKAGRAKGGIVLLLLAIAGVLFVFSNRRDIFPGLGTPVRAVTVVVLVILGWALARNVARGLAPTLFARMDPGTAGTVGFILRLTTVIAMVVVALRVAGVKPETLAVGGAFTAVVLGLAAQQTIGNLFAGTVLLSNRPFRVGERVKLKGGLVAGEIEGVVGSLGLFYTTLIAGGDRMMIPNNVVLQLAIIPLREPERVELKATFDAKISPSDVQEMLERSITVPVRYPPDVSLVELDGAEVVVKIAATPQSPQDGAQLAGEVLAAVRPVATDTETELQPA